MTEVWPVRSVPMRRGHLEDQVPPEFISKIRLLIDTVVIGGLIGGHVKLKEELIQVALGRIGNDAISGQTLLLHVTIAGNYGSDPRIEMSVIPYPGNPTIGALELTPYGVAAILDNLVGRLHGINGLTVQPRRPGRPA